MTEFTSTQEQTTQLLTDWAKFRQSFSEDAPPRDTARTWGFEIETPDADTLHECMTREELETVIFCQDSSIEGYESGDDCECQCEWCNYHDCNCDECEVVGSADPDHDCGSSLCYQQGTEYQEVKTLDGGVKTTHPQALSALVRVGLESAKITDNCGLHMNIGSRDLTPAQVARVLTAYRLGAWLFDTLSGRVNSRFASPITERHELLTRQGEPTAKMTAINTGHHFYNMGSYGDPKNARLEFRQHNGTNNPAEVRAWAWLLVELVEFAKSNRPIYWLGRAKTLAEFRNSLNH